jgi:hypothetical protein
MWNECPRRKHECDGGPPVPICGARISKPPRDLMRIFDTQ